MNQYKSTAHHYCQYSKNYNRKQFIFYIFITAHQRLLKQSLAAISDFMRKSQCRFDKINIYSKHSFFTLISFSWGNCMKPVSIAYQLFQNAELKQIHQPITHGFHTYILFQTLNSHYVHIQIHFTLCITTYSPWGYFVKSRRCLGPRQNLFQS